MKNKDDKMRRYVTAQSNYKTSINIKFQYSDESGKTINENIYGMISWNNKEKKKDNFVPLRLSASRIRFGNSEGSNIKQIGIDSLPANVKAVLNNYLNENAEMIREKLDNSNNDIVHINTGELKKQLSKNYSEL